MVIDPDEEVCRPRLLPGLYERGHPPVGHWWDIGSQIRSIIDNVEPQQRVPKTMFFLLLAVGGDCYATIRPPITFATERRAMQILRRHVR